VHVRDGYEAHALLPPREKRGLVLVDPPFESRSEFEAAGTFLAEATKRFSGGIHALWYPLKNRHESERFVRRARRDCARPSVNCTLETGAPGEGQMRGCGLLVINPPFGFPEEAGSVLAWLAPRLSQGPRPAWTAEATP
jgi:23S rRNA (adenine2030-N6)-methyltransferase